MPLYDSLGENAVEFIIDHSSPEILFVGGTKLATLLSALKETKGSVKTVIAWGSPDIAAQEEVRVGQNGAECVQA